MAGISRFDREIRIKYFNNKLYSAISSGSGLALLGIIFGLFLREAGRTFFDHYAKFVLLPLIALTDIFNALLAWRQASLDGYETSAVIKAVVETLAALAIATAVILGFAVPALPLLVVPVIFTATLSFKALYNLVTDAYDVYQVMEVDRHREHYELVFTHTVGFLAMALTTITAGFALIGGVYIWGIAALIGTLIGLIFAIYKGIQAVRGVLKERQTMEQVEFSAPPTGAVPSLDITDHNLLLSSVPPFPNPNAHTHSGKAVVSTQDVLPLVPKKPPSPTKT